MKPSFLRLLKEKLRTIRTYLNANHFWLFEIVLKLSGDMEENAVPKPSSKFLYLSLEFEQYFCINYAKISLSRGYISAHNFDIICISETYLNSDTSDDDENLKIAGYSLIRADHPSNIKRGGVCIYYKHSLAFILLNIYYLDKCMNFEICYH